VRIVADGSDTPLPALFEDAKRVDEASQILKQLMAISNDLNVPGTEKAVERINVRML